MWGHVSKLNSNLEPKCEKTKKMFPRYFHLDGKTHQQKRKNNNFAD
jgi:hypothetical protein